jgi:hypothetical protein
VDDRAVRPAEDPPTVGISLERPPVIVDEFVVIAADERKIL